MNHIGRQVRQPQQSEQHHQHFGQRKKQRQEHEQQHQQHHDQHYTQTRQLHYPLHERQHDMQKQSNSRRSSGRPNLATPGSSRQHALRVDDDDDCDDDENYNNHRSNYRSNNGGANGGSIAVAHSVGGLGAGNVNNCADAGINGDGTSKDDDRNGSSSNFSVSDHNPRPHDVEQQKQRFFDGTRTDVILCPNKRRMIESLDRGHNVPNGSEHKHIYTNSDVDQNALQYTCQNDPHYATNASSRNGNEPKFYSCDKQRHVSAESIEFAEPMDATFAQGQQHTQRYTQRQLNTSKRRPEPKYPIQSTVKQISQKRRQTKRSKLKTSPEPLDEAVHRQNLDATPQGTQQSHTTSPSFEHKPATKNVKSTIHSSSHSPLEPNPADSTSSTHQTRPKTCIDVTIAKHSMKNFTQRVAESTRLFGKGDITAPRHKMHQHRSHPGKQDQKKYRQKHQCHKQQRERRKNNLEHLPHGVVPSIPPMNDFNSAAAIAAVGNTTNARKAGTTHAASTPKITRTSTNSQSSIRHDMSTGGMPNSASPIDVDKIDDCTRQDYPDHKANYDTDKDGCSSRNNIKSNIDHEEEIGYTCYKGIVGDKHHCNYGIHDDAADLTQAIKSIESNPLEIDSDNDRCVNCHVENSYDTNDSVDIVNIVTRKNETTARKKRAAADIKSQLNLMKVNQVKSSSHNHGTRQSMDDQNSSKLSQSSLLDKVPGGTCKRLKLNGKCIDGNSNAEETPPQKKSQNKLPQQVNYNRHNIGGSKDNVIMIESSDENDESDMESYNDIKKISQQAISISPPKQKRPVGDRVSIDAARIAIGKKVFRSRCELSIQFGTKNPYILFSFFAESKKKDFSCYLDTDLLELRYYIADEEENAEDSDESMTIIACRVSPNSVNKSDARSIFYSANVDDALNKWYITVEVRNTDDFRTMLEQMREHPKFEVFLSHGAEIDPKDLSNFTFALMEDSHKDEAKRMSRGTKKSSKDDDLLLVFPFDVNEIIMQESASDLKELGGDTLGVASVERDEKFNVKEPSLSSGIDSWNKIAARTHYVTIREEDKERLNPGEFLNDTLVDFWMRWISRGESSESKPGVHFFTSHFVTTLKDDGVDAVSSWTSKKKINIFEKKLIFLPVNASLHWSLCVVVNPGLVHKLETDDAREAPCLLFLDSLKVHRRNSFAKIIRLWLNHEWKRLKKSVHENPFENASIPLLSPKIPYQYNSCDCGVFVCRYAYNLYLLRHHKFTFGDIKNKFKNLITDNPAFQFKMSDVARIREELKRLICNLSKHYKSVKQQILKPKSPKCKELQKVSEKYQNELSCIGTGNAMTGEDSTKKGRGVLKRIDSARAANDSVAMNDSAEKAEEGEEETNEQVKKANHDIMKGPGHTAGEFHNKTNEKDGVKLSNMDSSDVNKSSTAGGYAKIGSENKVKRTDSRLNEAEFTSENHGAGATENQNTSDAVTVAREDICLKLGQIDLLNIQDVAVITGAGSNIEPQNKNVRETSNAGKSPLGALETSYSFESDKEIDDGYASV